MSINLVWRTDVHFSDDAPSSRLDNWSDTVISKLGQVRDIAKEVKAKAILDGGDFFHIKAPNRNSHELVQRAAQHHQGYTCPVYCTPGNHDSVYGDYSFLPQQPLGVLYASNVFKRLYDNHEAIFETGRFVGISGTQMVNGSSGYTDKFRVRVVGIPYHGTKYDMERFLSIKKGSEDILICVAHVLASLQGGTMFEGEDIIKYSSLLDTAPDIYCFGHWHMDQGVEELGGKTFINIGSLTRGSLSQDEVQRQPACAVIKCGRDCGPTLREVEVRRLEVKPAEEVFDVEGRNRQVKKQVEMDAFVSKIRDTIAPKEEGLSLTEVVGSVQNLPEAVKERALSYLEKV